MRVMEQFLDKNPGLRSRIAFHVPFSDYDTAELCAIARLICKSKGVSLTENAARKLPGVFEEARKQSGFGNGRYVRNIIELSKMNQVVRILEMDPEDRVRVLKTKSDVLANNEAYQKLSKIRNGCRIVPVSI